MGTYNGWIRNGRTGARRLDLPIVSDGATPGGSDSAPARRRGGQPRRSAGSASTTWPRCASCCRTPRPTSRACRTSRTSAAGARQRRWQACFSRPTRGPGGIPARPAPAVRRAPRAPRPMAIARPPATAARRRLPEIETAGPRWQLDDVTSEILSLGFSGRRLVERRRSNRPDDEPTTASSPPERHHPAAADRATSGGGRARGLRRHAHLDHHRTTGRTSSTIRARVPRATTMPRRPVATALHASAA